MHKVILIDDEPLARQLIASFISKFPEFTVVAECGDGFEGFKAIQEHEPDLIFLDVQMPKINGFEMLELLEKIPAVIFTTAFDEYALKAFEANAVDYLLKPVTRSRFEAAINKSLQLINADHNNTLTQLAENKVYSGYQHRIVVKDNGLIRIIPSDEIHYVEANDDYVKIITPNGNYLKKSTLKRIEDRLDPKQFVRIHRSYLLPVKQLVRIEPYEKDSHVALLKTGDKIPVSKSGMAKLKDVLGW